MRIDRNNLKEYAAIHHWLKTVYGKPTHCKGKRCNGISKSYQWALLRGKNYEYKRSNFTWLCRSCHALYDLTDETIRLCRESSTGRRQTKEEKEKKRTALLGIPRPAEVKAKISKAMTKYPVLKLADDGLVLQEYPSQASAAKATGISFRAIWQAIKRGNRSGGYYWKKKLI